MMGAESSVQVDGKSPEEDASASTGEVSAEVKVLQEEGGALDSKVRITQCPAAMSRSNVCRVRRDSEF